MGILSLLEISIHSELDFDGIASKHGLQCLPTTPSLSSLSTDPVVIPEIVTFLLLSLSEDSAL